MPENVIQSLGVHLAIFNFALLQAYKVFKQQRQKDMLKPEAPFLYRHKLSKNQAWTIMVQKTTSGENHMYELMKNMQTFHTINDGKKQQHLVQRSAS